MDSRKIVFPEGSIQVNISRESGLPVVLVHGNSLSSGTFVNQFESELFKDYKLVAFDFPGHGESGAWTNPEKSYSAGGYVGVLLQLVNQLDLKEAVFAGHSLGGHILLHAAGFLPKASGYCFFGSTPFTVPPRFDLAFLPHPAVPLLFNSDWTEADRKIITEGLLGTHSAIPPELNESLDKTIPQVRQHIAASISSGVPTDETYLLATLNKPVALFHGAEDKLVNAEYLEKLNVPMLWNARIEKIPSAGHCPQLENPGAFNQVFFNFLKYYQS